MAELDVQSLCAVTFEDSGVYRNLPRESAQLVNGFPKAAEEEAAAPSRNVPVRVTWADGHTYDATMIGEYQLAMAELQGDTDSGITIPAVSLEDPSAVVLLACCPIVYLVHETHVCRASVQLRCQEVYSVQLRRQEEEEEHRTKDVIMVVAAVVKNWI